MKKKYVQTETYGVLIPDVIISFTTIEFPDQSVMEKAGDVFKTEMVLLADKLRPMGMIRFHSSRMFMPEVKFMFGNWLEYRDMEAYEACDKIWNENAASFGEKYGELFADVKVESYRGQVASDFT